MDTKQQPEALRLAEMLTADEWPGSVTLVSYAQECVAELLRQHAENETVRAGYAAARLEIESLKAQLHAAQTGEYPALVCDYCGALTPDPWHSSGMLHGKMSKHIHSCDACAPHGQAPAGAAQADSVQEDAARYRFLRDGEWRGTDLEPFIRLQLNTLWDAKIDAARAAQEGGK